MEKMNVVTWFSRSFKFSQLLMLRYKLRHVLFAFAMELSKNALCAQNSEVMSPRSYFVIHHATTTIDFSIIVATTTLL